MAFSLGLQLHYQLHLFFHGSRYFNNQKVEFTHPEGKGKFSDGVETRKKKVTLCLVDDSNVVLPTSCFSSLHDNYLLMVFFLTL